MYELLLIEEGLSRLNISGDRFWFLVLRTPASVHIHTIKVLPGTRSHTRRALRHANRHVVPRLHISGTSNGLSPPPRRRRGGPTGMHNGAVGHAPATPARAIEKGEELHKLQGLSPVLYGIYAGRWYYSAQGRPQPAREAPRPPGLQGPQTGPEGLRGPALPGFHQALPGVGPGRPDDAQRRAPARVAQAPAAAPPKRKVGVGVGDYRAAHAQK